MTRNKPPLDQALRTLGLIPRLYRWAMASAQANNLGRGLSLRQFGVLYALRDGPLSPGQLARRQRVTPAVITGLLDRLEQRGYVRREADPEDRRRLRLVLTESGREVGQALRQAMAGDMAAKFSSASPAELKELDGALDLLERALAALEARTPPDTEPGEDAETPPRPPRRGSAKRR
ncbi:DNA-binding MarR family transcriptional regulator [Archangium gephyra]|uniref:DNA-binding MarR family transcriptional regulator n=1 Tax=Archangium gephyra TaxID=48 RepID=A0AAC8Q0M8_9BACT|nr:MarR family transcriptional regulator [Archangium gephyra]AKI98675.1 Transcriptional regulator, MarR family [Archangium gephyra]REG30603.1 DNA-binding MarR family transcriptional regulator [Archangium gephyra]